MKKLVSLAIAVIMIISALAFSVNAGSSTGKDPTYAASESKVIKVKTSTKVGGSVGAFTNASNKSYVDKTLDTTATYANDPPKNGDLATAHESLALNPMGSKYSVFCEKGSTDPEYNTYLIAELGTGETVELTKISTIVIAVPGTASPIVTNGKPVIDNFAVYYSSTDDWKPVAAASATADNADVIANKANFKELFTVKNLLKEDSETQFTESADGSFRYYEATLAEPVEAKYLLIGSNLTMYSFISEIAAFSPAEAATEAPAETGTTAPAANTGDNAIIIASVVGAVAVIGMAVSLRKKEYN